MWKHRSEFRKAILLLKLRRGIHVLGDIAAALDTGGTLVFRNEDGSKRTIEIPQLVADRGTISICDCHSVDVVASEPKNRAEFQKRWRPVGKTRTR